MQGGQAIGLAMYAKVGVPTACRRTKEVTSSVLLLVEGVENILTLRHTTSFIREHRRTRKRRGITKMLLGV